VSCALFALLAFGSGFLPLLFVIYHPDGSVAAAFVGVSVDPPTGELWDSTEYTPWPLVLSFAAASYYYFVRATRANPASAVEGGIPLHSNFACPSTIGILKS